MDLLMDLAYIWSKRLYARSVLQLQVLATGLEIKFPKANFQHFFDLEKRYCLKMLSFVLCSHGFE